VKVEFRSSFAKDLKIVDKALAVGIQRVIAEVQRVDSLSDIANLRNYAVAETITESASAIIE
jgi:hypothetical protein